MLHSSSKKKHMHWLQTKWIPWNSKSTTCHLLMNTECRSEGRPSYAEKTHTLTNGSRSRSLAAKIPVPCHRWYVHNLHMQKILVTLLISFRRKWWHPWKWTKLPFPTRNIGTNFTGCLGWGVSGLEGAGNGEGCNDEEGDQEISVCTDFSSFDALPFGYLGFKKNYQPSHPLNPVHSSHAYELTDPQQDPRDLSKNLGHLPETLVSQFPRQTQPLPNYCR